MRHEGATYQVPVFELRGSLYDASNGWAFTVHFDEPTSGRLWDLVSLPDDLVLEGHLEDGRRLRLPTVPWRRHGPGMLEGVADRIELDVENLESDPDDQFLYARLSPTDVAIPVAEFPIRSWTGEITSDKRREAPKIETDLGPLEFFLAYDYEEFLFEGGKGLARLPVPRLSVKVLPEARTRQVEALMSHFEELCNGVCDFLSVLSRRRVVWMSLHHSAHWTEPESGLRDSTIYRHSVSTPKPQLVDDLVNGWQLQGEGLSGAYRKWCDLPYHESMRKASTFLHQCFGSGYIEDRALGAFMALETLTDGYSKHRGILDLVDDDGLRRLRGELHPRLRECAKAMGLDKVTRKGLYAKLSELKMAPLVPRILSLVESTGVEWADLWPVGTQLDDALRVAYERRSNLVHAGRTDRNGLFRDTVRLHALTERMISKLCDLEERWLHVAAYSHVRYVSDKEL